MAEKSILVPKMGESINEATVIRWLKNVGDTVEKDEPIVEIATDKVDNEIPSTESGVLTKQLFQDGDVVKVGEPIALISTESTSPVDQIETAATEEINDVVDTAEKIEAEIQTVVSNVQTTANSVIANESKSSLSNSGSRFYSPLVMSIAAKEGLSQTELESINGTGLEGRVTKSDVLEYLKNRGSQATKIEVIQETFAANENKDNSKAMIQSKPAVSLSNGDEVIEMDRVRKMIADHMVMSMQTSPHVTSFVEADVTNLVEWRNRIKGDFKKREGENITFTPIFMWAIAKAIKDYPMINVSVDGNNIIKKRDINIGMAVAQKNGNLIVPVVKRADSMNLLGLTRSVNDLAVRARENKLVPDEIQGGTYTLTNVGSFGNIMGTPVINQPQVAIMAVGTIQKKPAVLETEHGDVIAIRHMMYLSHSYDHRVVDGALGGMFVKRVAEYLEQWDPNTEI